MCCLLEEILATWNWVVLQCFIWRGWTSQKLHFSQLLNQHGTSWAVTSTVQWADCFWECCNTDNFLFHDMEPPPGKCGHFILPLWHWCQSLGQDLDSLWPCWSTAVGVELGRWSPWSHVNSHSWEPIHTDFWPYHLFSIANVIKCIDISILCKWKKSLISKCQELVFADISFYGHVWLGRGPNSSGSVTQRWCSNRCYEVDAQTNFEFDKIGANSYKLIT